MATSILDEKIKYRWYALPGCQVIAVNVGQHVHAEVANVDQPPDEDAQTHQTASDAAHGVVGSKEGACQATTAIGQDEFQCGLPLLADDKATYTECAEEEIELEHHDLRM